MTENSGGSLPPRRRRVDAVGAEAGGSEEHKRPSGEGLFYPRLSLERTTGLEPATLTLAK